MHIYKDKVHGTKRCNYNDAQKADFDDDDDDNGVPDERVESHSQKYFGTLYLLLIICIGVLLFYIFYRIVFVWFLLK